MLTTSAFGGAGEAQVRRAWEPLKLYRQVFNRAGATDSSARTDPGRLSGAIRLLRRWAAFPDLQITWLPAALGSALQVVRREAPQLVYSTYPPASALLLGLLLKRWTGLPWVADFRDSWTYDPLDPDLPVCRQGLEQRLERAVVEGADAVIAATVLSAAHLQQAYPQAASRIQVITNGFDPDECRGTSPGPPAGDPLRITYTGSFSRSHPRRTPQPLFTALESLLSEDPAWAGRLRLVLAGSLSPAEQQAAARLAQAGAVELRGPVPRPQALELQGQAHLLLLVDHPRPWPASNVPGKFYEYLAARRPILALAGPGMVARLMGQLQAGLCAAPDDPQAIRRALVEVYAQFRQGRLKARVDEALLRQFHRRELTRQLARCFDCLLEPS